jgi:diaminopimelate epimerase
VAEIMAQAGFDWLAIDLEHSAISISEAQDLIRVIELSGVEGETLACGTGVTASALVCAAKGQVESPVACLTRGGDTLNIYFSSAGPNGFGDVYLEGPATICFRGQLDR